MVTKLLPKFIVIFIPEVYQMRSLDTNIQKKNVSVFKMPNLAILIDLYFTMSIKEN